MSDYVPDAYGKAVAVGPDGDVWAPTSSTLELLRYSKSLDYKGTYSISDLGAEVVEGVVVDRDNNLYVPDRKNIGGIYKAKLSGNYTVLDRTFGKNGHAANCGEVRQIAISSDGSIYVGDFNGSTIFKVDIKTGKETVLTAKVAKPYHIAVDKIGRVYVAQYDAPTALSIIAPDGTTLASFTAAELGINDRSAGVAVNAAGTKLFVVDQKSAEYGGIVKEFSLIY
jgi:DNA-binding beta-propeller fold protein YncE